MKKSKWLSLALGIMTATGGFLDAGTIATSGEAGAKFGLGLIWAMVVATVAVIAVVEMVGRFTAVSQKTYADAIREKFGFKFYLFPLVSELIAEGLMLTAETGGMAIALSLFTGSTMTLRVREEDENGIEWRGDWQAEVGLMLVL